jgi:hypothetical protein
MINPFLAGAASVEVSINSSELQEYKNNFMRNVENSVYPGGSISPIYAKVLITKTALNTMVLISIDIHSTQKPLSNEIRNRISKQLKIKFEEITVCTSQNHSALYSYPPDWSYTNRLIQSIVDAAEEAYTKLQTASIGAIKGYCHDISYNYMVPITDDTPVHHYPHSKHKGGIIFARDYNVGRTSGRPFDSELGVIRIDSSEGNPIAVVFNFCAHPATTIDGDYMHGDYSGFAAQEIEAALPGAIALFTQGSLGNGNSIPIFGTVEDAKKSGHKLAVEVLRVLPDIQTTSTVESSVKSEPFLVTQIPFSTEHILKIKMHLEQFILELEEHPEACWIGEGPETYNLSEFFPKESRRKIAEILLNYCINKLAARERGDIEQLAPNDTEIQVFRWNDIALCLNAFEMYYQTGLEIKRLSPHRYTFPVGNANSLVGYVVPEEEFNYGGYCAIYSPMFVGKEGMYDPFNCDRIIARFREMLS